jgi:hypothetical protein
MMQKNRVSNERKNLHRLAGEFLVASRLTQRGFMVTLQWGTTIGYDILVFDKAGHVAFLEVKSTASILKVQAPTCRLISSHRAGPGFRGSRPWARSSGPKVIWSGTTRSVWSRSIDEGSAPCHHGPSGRAPAPDKGGRLIPQR